MCVWLERNEQKGRQDEVAGFASGTKKKRITRVKKEVPCHSTSTNAIRDLLTTTELSPTDSNEGVKYILI